MCIQDARLDRVTSDDGRSARDHLVEVACRQGWLLQCRGRQENERGTYLPHIQFRRTQGERPYPYSLNLNSVTPTFYVRRPTGEQRRTIPNEFERAHEMNGELKIPVFNRATAARIAEMFLV